MPPRPSSSRISKRESTGGTTEPAGSPERPSEGRSGGTEGGVTSVRSRWPHTGQVVTWLSGGISNWCPLTQYNTVVMAWCPWHAAAVEATALCYHSRDAAVSHGEVGGLSRRSLRRAGGVSPRSG